MNHFANRQIRFGLVGTGAISQAYVQAFPLLKDAQLAGVADIRPESARALAETAGCAAYDSYQRMAEDVELDAVIVCTPPVSHPEVCMYFLQRRLHVLCEKPLAIDVQSAQQMLACAEESDVTLAMASKFRYSTDVVRARSILLSGILGDIVLYENSFTAKVNMADRWNSRPEISGGGVLIDNGTHSLDIMRYLLGPIEAIQVIEGKRVQNIPVEDSVHILCRTASGTVGSVYLSWSIHRQSETFIDVHGTHGTVSVGWASSRYRQSSSPEWVTFGSGYNKVQALTSQLSNFIGSMRGQEMLLISGEDALSSVETVDAAYRALKSTRWTDVRTRQAVAELAAGASSK